ncbi:MAG: cold shock domain-containing protein [Chloroflexia bacterium]|nr:cold shock domain-containing protein [Chloroflexia bacterium]
MSSKLRTLVCLRCGRAFASSPTYLQFLARRGARVTIPTQCPACFIKSGPLPKEQGQVKWFNPHRHYGFIETEAGDEAFFHETQVLGENASSPHEGQKVQFHLHYPLKGPEALNVELFEE